MVTFIRLCLCILLGSATLVLLFVAGTFALQLGSAYHARQGLKSTTCSAFVSAVRSGRAGEIATYRNYFNVSRSHIATIVDSDLGADILSYREIAALCLKKPELTLYNAVIGYTPADITRAMQTTLDEEAIKQSTPQSPDYATPLPSSNLMPPPGVTPTTPISVTTPANGK